MRNPAKAPTRFCDCGKPAEPGCWTCSACAWLDGASAAQARVIGALRVLGGTGSREALQLEANLSERTLWRTLAKLRQLGRIAVRHDGEHALYALCG